MVYISSDGTVSQNQPWSIQRLINVLWAIVAAVIFFFKSLVGLDGSSNTGRSGSKYGKGGGGDGGGNGPGGRPKRMGRITTIEHCSIPGGG